MTTFDRFFILKTGEVNIHFDFEFIDDVEHGDLEIISLGVVVETEKTTSNFYAINKGFVDSDAFKRLAGEENTNATWMRNNVFKHIAASAHSHVTGSEVKTGLISDLWPELVGMSSEKSPVFLTISAKDQPKVFGGSMVVGNNKFIATALMKFIEGSTKAKIKVIRPWAYHASTDTMCLHKLFGGMMNLPDNLQSYSYDLRALPDMFGIKHEKLDAKGPHHPLLDAQDQFRVYNDFKKMVMSGKH